MTAIDTQPPILDVRFHGEYWGQSGLTADIVENPSRPRFSSFPIRTKRAARLPS
jgi:hypothetical protein